MLGPKKRNYRLPQSERPDKAAWTAFLAQTGPQGGCAAETVSFDTLFAQTNGVQIQNTDSEWAKRMASDDWKGLSRAIHHLRLRKAVPDWSCPAELWRQLFHPKYYKTSLFHGVGYQSPVTSSFKCRVLQLLQAIRQFDQSPLSWHRSSTQQLDKRNNKTGSRSLRLINLLDPFGRAFYNHLWARCIPQSSRSYAAGYAVQKSRLEPIFQQKCLGFRLRKAKISHLTSFYDCANAFYSVHFECLDQTIHRISVPADKNLLRQRFRQATIQVHACDGTLELQTGSGTLQGDGLAAQLFLEPYHPVLDIVQQQSRSLDSENLLDVRDPIHNVDVNVSLSSYADDVAGKLCGRCAQELAEKSVCLSNRIDHEFASIGLGQNRDKQEHVPFFAGSGARAQYKAMFMDNLVSGKVCRKVRYLGPPYTFNGSSNSEVEERIVAARLGWVACGRFWSRLSRRQSHRGKLCVFRGMVYTPLLSGLEACVLDKSAYSKLDSCVLRYGRKLMQGQGCKKLENEDGTVVYKALPSSAVWAFLRLLPSKDELFIRRIKWYQSMARTPSLHSVWFACIFGTFSFESQPTIDDTGNISSTANPWAQQFHRDIHTLAEIEEGDQLLSFMAGQSLRLFQDLREDFIRLDVNIFRAIPFSVSIPPPEYQPDIVLQPALEETPDEVDAPFKCECLVADGTQCAAAFSTRQRLAVHISNTQGGTHGHIPEYRKLVVTNQCVFCRRVFSSVRTTQRHVRQSLSVGHCRGLGSQTVFHPEPPKSLDCSFCGWSAPTLDLLFDHMAQHVQRQGVQNQ